jgi:hypothetical protein
MTADPGGKQRVRMLVAMASLRRVDLPPPLTDRCRLDETVGSELSGGRRDLVVEVTPGR